MADQARSTAYLAHAVAEGSTVAAQRACGSARQRRWFFHFLANRIPEIASETAASRVR